MNKLLLLLITLSSGLTTDIDKKIPQPTIQYIMPDESEPHEGTWLQWPHAYQYGNAYQKRLDPTWVAMTKALSVHEKVHIVAYDQKEQNRITALLEKEKITSTNIDFHLYPTNDVWVRDNGPIYARTLQGKLVIQDWGFNAWGQKKDAWSTDLIQYKDCDQIPSKIARDQNTPLINLNQIMINEGGSIEIDGNGTLLACKSSILNSNRNPGMTQVQAEHIFRKYLGVNHFIWLEGQVGLEITDQHIDGFARFVNHQTILTMSQEDLTEFEVHPHDIKQLYSARNKNHDKYNIIQLPLTKNYVKRTDGKNIGFRASYVNFYVANKRVIVPNYNDPNDTIANQIIQKIYPNRIVVGVNVQNLSENGGSIHCVTQQQPKL